MDRPEDRPITPEGLNEAYRKRLIKRLQPIRPGLFKHLQKIINKPDYQSVFFDLVEYTGLSEEEVCVRVLRRPPDRGHFESEWKYRDPKSAREVTHFYMFALGYLFGNADRPFWVKLDALDKRTHPRVLEYGGGIGTNVLGLAKRGFQVTYVDISLIQADFLKFRLQRHGVEARILDPRVKGKIDTAQAAVNAGPYDAISCQDVFEHLPDYEPTLFKLCSALERGGLMVEYSPFNRKAADGSWALHSPLHFKDKGSFEKSMERAGMKLVSRDEKVRGIWEKL